MVTNDGEGATGVISAALQDSAIAQRSPFDRMASTQAAVKYGTGGLPCVWPDSRRVAKQTWHSFREDGGYGLANLTRAFNLLFQHHDAAEDTQAAGLVLLRAIHDGDASLQDLVDELLLNRH